ncbi:alpha,alpha-trehalose-phosphate synthase (UDP-forming) [Paracoccus seriniphilus]|uniref:Trehalose 6-phosphate synthase n=1 Tax=Paracoccus seriniphilus TaxID=184748 RepID=A0A239PLX8_9RHOB|nr:trehalose-6-phosphate synthase [Paracoccus seriniphilus]WCR13817.1 trehalose-6-phosphate synthase [Paracoccus seriniphilus]SNT68565.1 trehalose 6-phosphate synthase [Paracoccus seriniphilus]
MSRLVVISNRLPLGDNPSGGLVVALQDSLRNSGGLWIGFSGETPSEPADSLEYHPGAEYQRASFDLTPADHEAYYLGYSNSVLWPLCHGRADLTDIDPDYGEGYRRVNARIAALVAPHIRPDDRIWVHDYQLFPLAAELRARGIGNPIGHFLHIPFPGPENCAVMPDPHELFEWLSQYDLLGFQTHRDLANFTESARQLAELIPLEGNRIRLCGRELRRDVFPIGIDTASFIEEARTAQDVDRMRSLTGAQMMIGVDRLDYSKGIPQRFRAFQLLLENHVEFHEKISFLQIAPPTREEVEAYQDIREETEHLAGRINGQFATVNWTPIRFIHRPLPRNVLAGLYRQARIGLVTPLADGMNLVAKEYVAAQDVSDPGVLILSRFAGAAETMQDALVVNPHDPHEMAEAMAQAMHMTANERRQRHSVLLRDVVEHDVSWWSARYLDALAGAS